MLQFDVENAELQGGPRIIWQVSISQIHFPLRGTLRLLVTSPLPQQKNRSKAVKLIFGAQLSKRSDSISNKTTGIVLIIVIQGNLLGARISMDVVFDSVGSNEAIYAGSLTRLFFHFRQTQLVSLAASTQALITLGSPSPPELPEQPERSLSSTYIISFFVKFFTVILESQIRPLAIPNRIL